MNTRGLKARENIQALCRQFDGDDVEDYDRSDSESDAVNCDSDERKNNFVEMLDGECDRKIEKFRLELLYECMDTK